MGYNGGSAAVYQDTFVNIYLSYYAASYSYIYYIQQMTDQTVIYMTVWH